MFNGKLQSISDQNCVINYQSLPCHVKGLATQACIAELMDDLEVCTIGELYGALEQCPDYNQHRLQTERRAHFYEKKYYGEQLRRKDKIETIRAVSRQAGNALQHPLWHFLSEPSITIQKVTALFASLPKSRFHSVLRRNTAFLSPPHTFRKPCKSDGQFVEVNAELDRYLINLLVYLGAAAKYKCDAPLEGLMTLFRQTLCFLAFQFPTIHAWTFFYLLTDAIAVRHINSEKYPKNYRYWPERRQYLLNKVPPNYFGDIRCPEDLADLIQGYRKVGNLLCSRSGEEITSDMKIKFLSKYNPVQFLTPSESFYSMILKDTKIDTVHL